MGLFKRSKKSLEKMCLGSNSMRLFFFLWLATVFIPNAYAESGIVNVTGSGHDSAEATVSLLKSAVARYFKTDQSLVRPILQYEILPNASSFVQSYKLADGSKPGNMTIGANIDLDVLKGLFSLTPKFLGETGSSKVIIS